MRFGDMPSTVSFGHVQPVMTCADFGPEHGVYSAERGDYFAAPDDQDVTCGECGAEMVLVRRVEYWEQVTA